MKGTINPKQLKRARLSRGLSMSELAKRSGVLRQSISKYEMGTSEPRGESLLKIINVLDYPMSFFSQKNVDHNMGAVFFRSQAASTNKLRDMQAVRLQDIVDCYDYLSEYINFPKFDMSNVLDMDIGSLSDEIIERTANNLRVKWNIGEGPINDLSHVLEANGIIIAETNMSSRKLDAVSQFIDGRPFIALTDNHESAVRRRFSEAHEVGHIILHNSIESIFALDNTKYKKVLEYQANYFASCFLMPQVPFMKSLLSTSLDFYIELKKTWKVSIAAMIKRTSQLGLLSEDQILYLNKKLSWNKWRKEEPLDDSIEVEKPVIFKRSLAMLLESGLTNKGQLANTLGLPRDELSKLFLSDFEENITEGPKLRLIK